MSHEAWLALAILGVVLFLGNIIVTPVWKLLADRTQSPPVVAYAQRLVTVTDVAFTATGVVLIIVSGQGDGRGLRRRPRGLGLADLGLVALHRLRRHLGGRADPDRGRCRRGSRGRSAIPRRFRTATGGSRDCGPCSG